MFLPWYLARVIFLGFPRARGDVPATEEIYLIGGMFSPRTRGCSQIVSYTVRCDLVFPAHAGMFRFTKPCSP